MMNQQTQGLQQGGDMFQMRMAEAIRQNPEAAQQIAQLVGQSAIIGELDIPPEMLPHIARMVQVAGQNPAAWPQIHAQAVQMGADPSILPPPNATPEQVQQFVAGVLMLVYFIGQMGQGINPAVITAGMRGAQGAQMQPQHPPVQGYAAGGMVAPQQFMMPQGGMMTSVGTQLPPVVGYQFGGVVAPPMWPMQMSTGDDQLIAAKTGEGVLNQQAVATLGGPQVVDALNYSASGIPPGGRPVRGMW